MATKLRLPVLSLLVLALAACGDDGTTTPEPQRSIAIISGNGQTANTDQALPAPLVVRVSEDGAGLSGATVTWSVTAGGGALSASSSTTDASGLASTMLTLGASTGTNTVQAASTGANGSPVTFTATASGPPPATASVSVDDNVFNPTSATIAAGGQVTWTWAGTNSHNVTFASGGPAASPTQTSGTYSATFANTGTFQYQCTIHGAAMSGEVVVQ